MFEYPAVPVEAGVGGALGGGDRARCDNGCAPSPTVVAV